MAGRQYDLRLEFAPESLEYRGRVTLIEDGLPTELTLDAVGLRVHAAQAHGVSLSFALHEEDGGGVTLRGIPPGSPDVTLDFSGTVGQGTDGLYVSPFGGGRLLTTHFEPANARRMFPCRDRPDAKAVFRLAVVAPEGLTVISNAEVERTSPTADGRRLFEFAPTERMSTYLLYVGVAAFEEIRAERHGWQAIVAAPPGRAGEGKFALEQALRTLDYFSQYYGIPYPLPKLHLIAVPSLSAGAMENWGAITFQEYLLLADDRRTSMLVRQALTTALMHEIAHQWFGDLVTMRWWSDVWLNESFATFASYEGRTALFPEWRAWDQYAFYAYDALLWDSLPHTHPVHVEVTDPDEISEIFDEISYHKGTGVLRMVEAYTGKDAFRQGVSGYLKEHRGGNAEAADLWRALAGSSGQPVDRLMPDWIDRSGHPVVRVHRQDGTLRLDQSGFAIRGPTDAKPWPIPLTYRIGATTHRTLFDNNHLEIPGVGTEPVQVDPGRFGFFRVWYDPPLRAELLATFGKLDPFAKWGLLTDSLAFLLAGEIELTDHLELLARFENESSSLGATAPYHELLLFYPLIHRVPDWEATHRRVFAAQSERLGLSRRGGDADVDRTLRERVQRARVRLDPAFARELAGSFADLEEVDPEMVGPILMAYGSTAGAEEYAVLREQMRATKVIATQRHLAGGLACAPRPDWLEESLDTLVSREITFGPWFYLFDTAIRLNPQSSEGVLRFLEHRAEDLYGLTGQAGASAVVIQPAVPLVGVSHEDAMRRWVATHARPAWARAQAKGLDLLEATISALRRLRPTG